MTVMTTIDVYGMTAEEYRRVMDRLGVEEAPEPGILLHITAQTDFGYRVIEVWDSADQFNAFVEHRLAPAAQTENITHKMEMKIEPVHNLFAPRVGELQGLASALPGGWRGRAAA